MASPSKRKRGRPKGSGKSPRKSTKRAETDDGERSAEGDGSLSLETPERVLVIFCSKCNTISGDTNSFVCTHDGLKTITLRSESPHPAGPRARARTRILAVTDLSPSLSAFLSLSLCRDAETAAYAVRMRQDRVETPTDGITAGR